MILITAAMLLVALFGVTLFAVNKSRSNTFGQSAEKAKGLPQSECVCWEGIGNSGHCIASEACE